jgi:hypothetical protein
MDATRYSRIIALSVIALAAGCAEQAAQPAAQPPTEEPVEPPQVVLDSRTAPGEVAAGEAPEDGGPIDAYLKRIEGALAGRKPKSPAAARQAADEQFAPEPPAEYAPRPAEPPPDEPAAVAPVESPAPAPPPAMPKPPVLANVQVRTSAPPRTEQDDAKSVHPNSTIDTTAMPPALRDFLERRPKADDASYSQQLDERILWALAGDYDRARKPLEFVTTDQRAIASGFVEALIALREAQDGDLGASAAAASSQLAVLQNALRTVSDLSVSDIRLCSAVRGFGQYDALEPARFTAGTAAEFVLYVEISDFASEKRADDLHYTVFDLKTQIVNKAGEQVFELTDVDITDRCRNLRRDFFIPRLVRLPAALAPGAYVAKVTITDKLGQKVAQARAAFELVARP